MKLLTPESKKKKKSLLEIKGKHSHILGNAQKRNREGIQNIGI